jgi:hypothetical protein
MRDFPPGGFDDVKLGTLERSTVSVSAALVWTKRTSCTRVTGAPFEGPTFARGSAPFSASPGESDTMSPAGSGRMR